jgi:hypothetical protein
MARELSIICTACKQPIDDGKPGSLEISMRDVGTCREQRAAWEAEHIASAGPGLTTVGWGALASQPDPARWQAFHDACTTSSFGDYYVSADEVQNWQDLVARTAHLMGKQWLQFTDWDEVLEGAASGRGTVIVPVTQP